MKQALFLMFLAIGSLTWPCGKLYPQTWRLTADAASDSLPQIAAGNDGKIWVVWLSDRDSIYNVFYRTYSEGTGWSDELRLTDDNVGQHGCKLANNPAYNRIQAMWDSAGYLLLSYFDSFWSPRHNVNEFGYPIADDSPFFVSSCSDSGYTNVSWTAFSGYSGHYNISLRRNDGISWDTIETVISRWAIWSQIDIVKEISSFAGDKPRILFLEDWSSVSGSGSFIGLAWWRNGDQYWIYDSLGPWLWPQDPAIGVEHVSRDTILVCFFDYLAPAQIKCSRYVGPDVLLDTVFIIEQNTRFHSGSSCGSYKPTIVWSDSSAIWINTYFDSNWSYPPKLASSPSLMSCIHPDIALVDTTAWVCYQNEGDIYVTRTTIPTGVAGQPELPTKRQKISLSACPNPSRGPVRFQRHGSINSNHTISIYDIAGRRVRSLDTDAWDGRDQDGRRAAPGVYFARLTAKGGSASGGESGNETATIKLTIIK